MDLSVIIPVCNTQNHIAACLRSITRCPRETIDMECIVVDDTGSDEMSAIVSRYIERDSRIKLVARERGEVYEVRNKGVEAASGRYILFLDADDRLCEDAWEQIEAAVEEEYADFVAFSYITIGKKGKFKARMLPLSDVISTDEQEARRLMYADSVLNTCWGKLFKSRIIRDNHIVFRTDFPVGSDFLFVSEYFEHCESYLMTKAMILYSPQTHDNIMRKYSMEERLAHMSALYEVHADAVKRCNDSALARCMQVYYFRILTELFCAYIKEYGYSKSALEVIYDKALRNEFTRRLLNEVDEQMISSGVKKYEYRLLRKGDSAKIRRYFSIKTMIQKD